MEELAAEFFGASGDKELAIDIGESITMLLAGPSEGSPHCSCILLSSMAAVSGVVGA